MKTIAVPVEPTEEIIAAMYDIHPCGPTDKLTRAYKAALAAAPPQPDEPTIIDVEILWAKYKQGNDANARMSKENFRAAVLEAVASQPEPADHLAAPDSRERAIIAAATALIPFLVEGWDEDDGPEHYDASNAACNRLIAAVKGTTNAAPAQDDSEHTSLPIGNPAPAAAPITSSEAVSACLRCGKVGAALNDGHFCVTFSGLSAVTASSGTLTGTFTVGSGVVTNNAAGQDLPNAASNLSSAGKVASVMEESSPVPAAPPTTTSKLSAELRHARACLDAAGVVGTGDKDQSLYLDAANRIDFLEQQLAEKDKELVKMRAAFASCSTDEENRLRAELAELKARVKS